MAVDGLGVAYAAAGFAVLWSGLSGASIKDTLADLLKGQEPPAIPPDATAASSPSSAGGGGAAPTGNTGASSASAAANQATARMLAISMGHASWTTGSEWADWVSLWNQESGWSASATNPGTGAYGIAQALGHGDGANTQGNVTNEYGGYGVSSTVAQDANSGDPAAQVTWGIQYIAETYGSPSAAWAHEVADNWY